MKRKFIISGGGTGGHIYPALAIADALKIRYPEAEILFVGAKGKMEMEKIPEAGYPIVGLPISGLQRKLSLANLSFPFKVVGSLVQAHKIISRFRPDAVIGTGGFASGPVLYAAASRNIPTLIQEQNALPGITNKILAKKVDSICVAYESALKYFPKNKTVITGNPVRKDFEKNDVNTADARQFFGLNTEKKTLLVLGGSLGAGKINQLVAGHLAFLKENDLQLLWQTGSYYYENYKHLATETVKILPFIKNMKNAYGAADVIVSRAGALTVSELCLVGKAVIFIPSPNVAEDHQTKNAKALSDKGAAILIKEAEADTVFSEHLLSVFSKPEQRLSLGNSIRNLATPNATKQIVEQIVRLVEPESAKPEKLFFLGIGGIGMSALARQALKNHTAIAGYDKVQSSLTRALEKEGAHIFYEDTPDKLPQEFQNPSATQVIYTPAVPKSSLLYEYFNQSGFKIWKRSEWLGKLSAQYPCLAIAGTHGKTTSSTLLAHLMKQSGLKITAFLGGISQNYHTNFIADGNEALVVEADEFDRSFHRLNPFYSAVTSTDADHLDIYGTQKEMLEAYQEFIGKTSAGGKVFVNEKVNLKGISYGFGKNNDYQIINLSIEEGKYRFDIKTPTEILQNFSYGLPGKHNLSNALLATAMALEWGIGPEKIRKGLENFEGVERRFTRLIDTADCVLIDDYAHHPSEIDAVYEALTAFYPNRKKTVVFQPHLYSRTRDFMEDFAASLSAFDRVRLLDIYPARELPIEGVTAQALMERIAAGDKKVLSKEELLQELTVKKPELLILLGAGDIADLTPPIKEILNA